MRFIALLRGSSESEAFVPSSEDMAGMGKYVEEAKTAGWLLATEGLHPSTKAARIKRAGGKRAVTDGPFTESKELIASYALLQVGSKEEARLKSGGCTSRRISASGSPLPQRGR